MFHRPCQCSKIGLGHRACRAVGRQTADCQHHTTAQGTALRPPKELDERDVAELGGEERLGRRVEKRQERGEPERVVEVLVGLADALDVALAAERLDVRRAPRPRRAGRLARDLGASHGADRRAAPRRLGDDAKELRRARLEKRGVPRRT